MYIYLYTLTVSPFHRPCLTQVCAYICVCMCVCVCVCMYVYVCVYVYVYMYIYMCMYMYVCVYKRILFFICIAQLTTFCINMCCEQNLK